MPSLDLSSFPLAALADQVGTPFFLYDGRELARRLAEITALTAGDALQARYAMKANSNRKVLEAVRAAGLWIDAVSGNEVLRARRAGFAMGRDAAGRDADRRRAARQRADRGAGARRDAQHRLARDDRRAARRRIRRTDRGAREPGLRPRPRAVVRHRRSVVEARHLAPGPGRRCASARRRPSCRSSSCTPTSAPARTSREFDDNLRRLVELIADALPAVSRRRGGEPGRRHPAPLSPGRAALRSRRLSHAAGRGGRAPGVGGTAPHPRRDRAGPLPRRRRRPARLPREGHQADRDQREGAGAEVHHGRRRLQRPGAAGDVRVVPPHLDRGPRRGPPRGAVRRRGTAVRERRRVHARRARAAGPAAAAPPRDRRPAGAARRRAPTAPR